MKTPVWVELVCRSCSITHKGRWLFGVTTARVPLREMVGEARTAGWVFKHDEAFCSADCCAVYEKESGHG